jgi:predicted double-glycine peptidase
MGRRSVSAQLLHLSTCLAGAVLLTSCTDLTSFVSRATPPRPVRSMLEARQDKVVSQTWDFSCGAAALATILRYQFGDPVTEREIVETMLRATDARLVLARDGFSMLDLKHFAERRGYQADGYGKMSITDLEEMAPVIVPLELRGFNHFVVFRGRMGDRVLLADPVFGNRIMSVDELQQDWKTKSGFVVSRRDAPHLANRLAVQASDFPIAPRPAPALDTAIRLAKAQPAPQTPSETGPVAGAVGPPQVPPPPPAPPPQKTSAVVPVHGQARAPASVPTSITDALLKRGGALLAAGDILGARLAYQRAADGGDGRAALAMGKTYDPTYLKDAGVVGVQAQPDRAADWYAKAAALGEREASMRLTRLRGIASRMARSN